MEQNFEKTRIIQELVPGREVTLAHVIASPDYDIFSQLSVHREKERDPCAVGIINVSPGDAALILADIAAKASGISVGLADRESGSLIITGTVSEVETSVTEALRYAGEKLNLATCAVTKT
ncbi:MAG: BMC domain-containing protein [Lachnospiraceae bacterium]|nr:BMC domain-containing protein [Lachnospiraceae bacterium]